jgi:hypothetical protein
MLDPKTVEREPQVAEGNATTEKGLPRTWDGFVKNDVGGTFEKDPPDDHYI